MGNGEEVQAYLVDVPFVCTAIAASIFIRRKNTQPDKIFICQYDRQIIDLEISLIHFLSILGQEDQETTYVTNDLRIVVHGNGLANAIGTVCMILVLCLLKVK